MATDRLQGSGAEASAMAKGYISQLSEAACSVYLDVTAALRSASDWLATEGV